MDRKEQVKSLFFKKVYPVHVKAAELKGNIKVDMYFSVTLQVVHPLMLIYVLSGDWFVPVSNAVAGAAADYARKFTFDQFEAEDKEGPNSDLTRKIMGINEDVVDTATGQVNQGIRNATGMVVVSVNFESFEITKDARQAELEEATQKAALAAQEAKRILKVGRAEAEIIKRKADAGGRKVLAIEKLAQGISQFGEGGGKVIGTGVLPTIDLTDLD
jgi:hypothetical protein